MRKLLPWPSHGPYNYRFRVRVGEMGQGQGRGRVYAIVSGRATWIRIRVRFIPVLIQMMHNLLHLGLHRRSLLGARIALGRGSELSLLSLRITQDSHLGNSRLQGLAFSVGAVGAVVPFGSSPVKARIRS